MKFIENCLLCKKIRSFLLFSSPHKKIIKTKTFPRALLGWLVDERRSTEHGKRERSQFWILEIYFLRLSLNINVFTEFIFVFIEYSCWFCGLFQWNLLFFCWIIYEKFRPRFLSETLFFRKLVRGHFGFFYFYTSVVSRRRHKTHE